MTNEKVEEKDTIYLVPHMHYDAIWAFTKEDYFHINMMFILKNVAELLEKVDYRFLIEQTAKEKFGVDVPVMWQADSFGLNAQLPQIYKKSGYKYVAFRRGASKRNPSEFLWEGLDGTRILAHWMPLGYRAGLDLKKLKESYEKLKEVAATSHILMSSGSGSTMPQLKTPEVVQTWNENKGGIARMKIITPCETLPRYALQRIENAFNFKTPLNIAFASYKPERDFIKQLVREENAKKIDAWIKSTDIGFYSVEYSWQKGSQPKQGSFNPDFFIKIGNDILAVEIKTDEDISGENRAKLKYAREHFNRINSLHSEYRYYFKFLSPQSYDLFFQSLREGQYCDFKSEIESNLEVEMITGDKR